MTAAVLLAASLWNSVVSIYVDVNHRVAYERLKNEPRLDAYIAALAPALPPQGTAERKATLINAYNAIMVKWIVTNYPVESAWRTKRPFREARHKVDGRMRSLDDIETELRNLGDPRIHATLVCAARSCPPLRREAYDPAKLDEQLDANTRQWLANAALNSFDAAKKTASVSSIFNWYAADFGNVPAFLTKYGPPAAAGAVKIEYKDYNWGLNDQGGRGESYGGLRFYIDYFRNR